MESFALYLLKSVIWLTGFALVYVLFLRNERFFLLNRIYLVAGLMVSFLFPFVSVHYTVELPLIGNAQAGDAVVSMVKDPNGADRQFARLILLGGYLSGVAFFLWIVLRQTIRILGIVRQSDAVRFNGARLVRSALNSHAFSFFSFVFVNPSISDYEAREIVNHEMVHIRQKHWLDLVLAELLRTLQWFNPLAWIYIRFIKQNHEYLADREALQQTSDPAVYRAVLLNQITGSPVISLTNSFYYSVNKKRFNMMKNIVSSPYRKMKLLLILPVFAIVLYAFAIPEYHYVLPDGSNSNTPAPQGREVKGKVVRQDGKPLEGSAVVLVGTTTGTVTGPDGSFKLADIPADGALAVTYVGFKSKVVKPVFNSDMTISLVRDTVRFGSTSIPPPPPPPPPSTGSKQGAYGAVPPPPPPPPPGTGDASVSVRGTGPEPLYYVDGKPSSKEEVARINPNDIQAIKVLKGENGVKMYGEKARDGVIEVELKNTGTLSAGNALPDDKLIILDGKEMNVDLKTLDPNTIESINVLKNESAVSKYGEKGKNGVIIITTKKSDPSLEPVTVVGQPMKSGQKAAQGSGSSLDAVTVVGYGSQKQNKEMMTVVEQLPEFPGGKGAMDQWIQSNLKYPADAVKAGKEGTVNVSFLVETTGKVTDVKVIKSVEPQLDAEARRVVSSMPDFNPGRQAGKPVEVQMMVSVFFKLK